MEKKLFRKPSPFKTAVIEKAKKYYTQENNYLEFVKLINKYSYDAGQKLLANIGIFTVNHLLIHVDRKFFWIPNWFYCDGHKVFHEKNDKEYDIQDKTKWPWNIQNEWTIFDKNVLFLILKNLKVDELIRISRVNKMFYRLVSEQNDNFPIWREFNSYIENIFSKSLNGYKFICNSGKLSIASQDVFHFLFQCIYPFPELQKKFLPCKTDTGYEFIHDGVENEEISIHRGKRKRSITLNYISPSGEKTERKITNMTIRQIHYDIMDYTSAYELTLGMDILDPVLTRKRLKIN